MAAEAAAVHTLCNLYRWCRSSVCVAVHSVKQSERERESSRRKRLLALLAAVVRCAVALRPAVHQSASLTCHRCCCPHSALHCPRLASYTASSAMSQRDYDDDDGYGGGQRQQDDKPLSFRSPTSRSTDRYATAADRYSAIATTSGASNGGRDDADRKTGGGDRYGDSRGGGGGGDRYGDRGGDRYSDRGGRGGDRYNSRGGDRGGDRGDDAERGADGSDKRRGGKTGDGFFSNSSGGGRGYERSERGGAGSGGGFRDRDDSADKEGGYQRRERRGRSTHTAVPSLCTAVTRLLSGPLIPLLCLRGSVCQMIGLGTIAAVTVDEEAVVAVAAVARTVSASDKSDVTASPPACPTSTHCSSTTPTDPSSNSHLAAPHRPTLTTQTAALDRQRPASPTRSVRPSRERRTWPPKSQSSPTPRLQSEAVGRDGAVERGFRNGRRSSRMARQGGSRGIVVCSGRVEEVEGGRLVVGFCALRLPGVRDFCVGDQQPMLNTAVA